MGAVDDVVGRAARGVQYLIGLQLFSRVLTFALNVLVVRVVAKDVIGVYNVQLQLVLAMALSLSRESLRYACLRAPETQEARGIAQAGARAAHELQQVVNLSWLCVPAGLAIAPATCAWFATREGAGVEGYAQAVWAFGAASVVELASEPFAAVFVYTQQYRTRLVVESAAAVVRVAVTYAAVRMGLWAFSLGQMAFAVCLVVGYGLAFLRAAAKGTCPSLHSFWQLDGTLVRLACIYTWQSLQKLVLTEGEKFVLLFSNVLPTDQGVFAVVNNLGSLVVRFLFQPVEEVCNGAFTKLSHSSAPESAETTLRVLRTVLRFMVLVGLCFACFGPPNSWLAVHIIYSSKYSDSEAPLILSWFCLYILLVAVNGTAESFVRSSVPEKDLKTFNWSMIPLSVVYVGLANVLLRIPGVGTLGLIWANCANMLLRIALSFVLTRSFFASRGKTFAVSQCLPSAFTLAALFGTLAVGLATKNALPLAQHTAISVGGFLVTAAIVFAKDREFLRDLVSLWRGRVN
eukprot:m51a1_g2876 putative protein rft1 homolog (517) ;mRNA; r:382949-385095